MERRQFIRGLTGAVVLGTVGSGTAFGKNNNGNGNGNDNGNGNKNSDESKLVNAEQKDSGAIVATDDDFVIAGQEITVDGGDFYKDDDSNDSYVIYNNGYSGEISDNTINIDSVAQISYPDATYGIRIEDATVDVTDNEIEADNNIKRRFVGVGFDEGGTGKITDNSISGTHRVGILATGDETDISVAKNDIIGPGPRSEGWADNGIQISDGASGSIKNNNINDHWYEPNSFVSSGLLLFSDEVVVQRNTMTDNDLAIGFQGKENNVIHNTIEVTYEETDTYHYGIYEVGGEDNGIRQNTISAENAEGTFKKDTDDDGEKEEIKKATSLYGILVFGDNAKLIGNDLSGWEDPILDEGDETKLPKPFDPEQ